MKPDQKAIYYLTADTLAAARNSPHLEGFRAKGMEVLLLTDRIDEWVAGASARVRGQAARQCRERGAPTWPPPSKRRKRPPPNRAFKETLERLGKTLARQDRECAACQRRLTDSPAVLVAGEFGVSLRMGRILKQAGQNNPFATLPILELNPKHPLVERLKDTADEAALRGSRARAV